MKILLVEPKYAFEGCSSWIPIGKACLASVLRENRFQVKIIDRALKPCNDQEFVKVLKEYRPDIVGTGGMTIQFEDMKTVARLTRQLFKSKVLLVGGGVHLTVSPHDGLDDFDFVVVGEGEDTFLELCEAYRYSRQKTGDTFKNIAGLCFRSETGELFRTKQRDFINDLDRLPLPAYDLLSVQEYNDFLITGEKAISIMTGRGCPYDCQFCASPLLSKRKVRNFSVEYTLTLIEHLVKTYKCYNFRIMDDTFAISKDRVLEFCEQIKSRGLRLNMTCLTHVKTCDFEMFVKMKEAGFSIVGLGIESGNDRILKLVNKGTTTKDAASAISDVKKAGLMVEGLFMIGNIGESIDTIEDSIKFARRFNPPYRGLKRIGYNYFQFATPFPGSRFFVEASDYGEVISLNYADYSHRKPIFIPRGLTASTLVTLRKKALKKANSAFLPKKLKKINKWIHKIKNLTSVD